MSEFGKSRQSIATLVHSPRSKNNTKTIAPKYSPGSLTWVTKIFLE